MKRLPTPQRLTFLHGRAFGPVVSPDGTKVAFTGSTGLQCDVYVMDADGNGRTRLTDGQGQSFSPAFSPDGRHVAYVHDPDGRDERYDIHLVGLEDGVDRQLTSTGKEGRPVYSPDGGRIVFQSHWDGTEDIYSMTPGGEGLVRLTVGQHSPGRRDPFGTRSMNPVFSPDGSRIAFVSSRTVPGENRFDVFGMDADGSGQRRLTTTTGSTAEPVYSPDGTWLAFVEWAKDPERRTVLWRVGADGEDQSLLEDSPGINHLGGFSPDGRHLVFTSTRHGTRPDITRNWDLYALDVASGGVARLTENTSSDMNPVFHPNRRHIIYRSDQDGPDELYALTLPQERDAE